MSVKSRVVCAAVAAWCALVGGCQRPVAVRDAGPMVGNQGGSWEVFFPPAGTASAAALAFAPGGPGFEVSRRDAALGAVARPYTVADAFDTRRDVPRIEDLRRFNLNTGTSESILYYRSRGRTIEYR